MAQLYTEVPLYLPYSIEDRIHKKFDHLIVCLNRRREQLIAEHRAGEKERYAENSSSNQILQQLTDMRTHLQTEMKEKVPQSIYERTVKDIETKMMQLEFVEKEVELRFECNTQQLEETISVLGQLVERETVPIPNYSLMEPQISIGKRGAVQGELDWPNGIAFDAITQVIYVAEGNMFSACIKVFSVTGKYINTFCKGQLRSPVGIAVGINGDEVYVSDSYLHSIFHFKLPSFQVLTKIGKKGTGEGVGEFSSPRQLTVAPNGSVFVADRHNNRVVVLTHTLEFKQSISHESMTQPCDVKLLDNKAFVLSISDSPCLHVFSQSGEKLRSLITCGTEGNEQVKRGLFFCFDKHHEILVSDYGENSIKVFSQEGALLHTLGYTQEKEKEMRPNGICPRGIAVTNDNKIICASSDTMFCLHILY